MVAVVGSTGIQMMPTSEYRARKLLKSGRAKIYKHDPFFAIQLLDKVSGDTEAMEYASDVGYIHVGISVKSDHDEVVSEQRDLTNDEVEHNRERAKHRRERRNHEEYREPRFDNRAKKPTGDWEKWFPPSLRHKVETQIYLFKECCKVYPIKTAYFEMGNFDTQLLKAIEEGKEPPQGVDYQHGERYLSESLRFAVFARDEYKCQICERSAFDDNAKIHAHHIGFWKHDRTNRMSNLLTVCEQCHTTANHKKGGKLYGLEPELKPFKGATFMTTVRYEMIRMLKEAVPDVEIHMCYGAGTKCTRVEHSIEKSHVNDAYCIGLKHPKHRTPTRHYEKIRRNDRCTEKFYDAVYIDTRTGEKTKAAELGSGRTKRNTHKDYENLRPMRGPKVSDGHRAISWKGKPFPCGSVVKIEKKVKIGETITAIRKVKSIRAQVKPKALKAKRQDSKVKLKPTDINWSIEFEKPLSDGTNSTSVKNVTQVISRPIKKGWAVVKP